MLKSGIAEEGIMERLLLSVSVGPDGATFSRVFGADTVDPAAVTAVLPSVDDARVDSRVRDGFVAASVALVCVGAMLLAAVTFRMTDIGAMLFVAGAVLLLEALLVLFVIVKERGPLA
ncbi:hypothetical protein HYW18_02125 [Candidatus Uhrbacteria bacterium]|nr:hypothetical protein [Candidatus Uhrbacteria bacterium]